MPVPRQLTPAQAARIWEQGGAWLLDVREPFEWALVHLPGSQHIPLGELAQRLGELDRGRPGLVLCHHGVRSAHAAAWLAGQGWSVDNVAGGIEAWAQTVDPSLARY
jgi:rhodanese-related sulfurtransferase